MKNIRVTPRTLPSIIGQLNAAELKSAIFIKPSVGKELFLLHAESPTGRPVLSVMAVRLMTLSKNCVVPVHLHRYKEKLYVQQEGALQVLVFIGGNPFWFMIQQGEELVIPPRHPHAVACFDKSSTTRIIASSQDGDDIMWEPSADKLIQHGMPSGK
ncbi:MAG: cupin domain-containing protein [Candidatus Liptonbacteria bacterium]|nr:cupin domain-containing protein [Candidatus Liptonbacteria bacterium]